MMAELITYFVYIMDATKLQVVCNDGTHFVPVKLFASWSPYFSSLLSAQDIFVEAKQLKVEFREMSTLTFRAIERGLTTGVWPGIEAFLFEIYNIMIMYDIPRAEVVRILFAQAHHNPDVAAKLLAIVSQRDEHTFPDIARETAKIVVQNLALRRRAYTCTHCAKKTAVDCRDCLTGDGCRINHYCGGRHRAPCAGRLRAVDTNLYIHTIPDELLGKAVKASF